MLLFKHLLVLRGGDGLLGFVGILFRRFYGLHLFDSVGDFNGNLLLRFVVDGFEFDFAMLKLDVWVVLRLDWLSGTLKQRVLSFSLCLRTYKLLLKGLLVIRHHLLSMFRRRTLLEPPLVPGGIYIRGHH